MKKRPESGFPYSTEYLNRTQASPLPLPEEEAPTLGFAPLSDEDEIRQELLSWMLIHEGTAEGVVPDTEGSDALFLENFISAHFVFKTHRILIVEFPLQLVDAFLQSFDFLSAFGRHC